MISCSAKKTKTKGQSPEGKPVLVRQLCFFDAVENPFGKSGKSGKSGKFGKSGKPD